MAKTEKRKENKLVRKMTFDTELDEFCVDAKKLKKQMKAHMQEGKALLDIAIETKDMDALCRLVVHMWGKRSAKSEASLGHLQKVIEDAYVNDD